MITVKLNNLKVDSTVNRISLISNINNNVGFEVIGHAMADGYGKDIVCAAVSAIAQTTAISLIELVEMKGKKVKIEQRNGFLIFNCLEIEETQFEKFLTVMNVFWIGIREIEKLYPDKIKVIEIIENN